MTIDISNPPRVLELGQTGENDFRQVQFDVSRWFTAYPSGTVSIIYSRPDGQLYPVSAGLTSSPAVWTISTSDVDVEGFGSIELRLICGNTIGKSVVIRTHVAQGLGQPSTVPDPAQPDWVATVIANAGTATTKASEAAASASAASASETNAAASKTEAAASAASASASETNAAASKDAAASSASSASSSEANALASKNAAATSENNALTYKNAAAASESNAAASEAAALASKNAASTSETNASASANKSESWAVGGTGSRTGEDTNNAKYWSDQAQAAAGGGVSTFNGRHGAVLPASGDYTAEQVGADSSGAAAAVQSNLDTHTANTSNPHSVTKAQVGLGSVDNTSDAAKPVSTAQASAIATSKSEAINAAASDATTKANAAEAAAKSASDPSGTASSAVTAHNSASDAHSGLFAAKADKNVPAAAGNIATLDANGNLTDSGILPSAKADATHTHAASDIASGILGVARGGTGAITAANARSNLGLANAPTLTGTSDPTTSTVGVVGQFYLNTTSGNVFKCTAASTTYTWSNVTAPNAVLLNQTPITINDLNIGDTFTLNETISGTTTAVPFILLSKNYNSTGRALVIRQDAIYSTTFGSTSLYSGSNVDTYCNSTYLAYLDSAVQSKIQNVSFACTTTAGGSAVGTLSRKVFLLSGTELNTTDTYLNTEGTALSYFSSNSSRIASYNGVESGYWTRSTRKSNSTEAYVISSSGNIGSSGISNSNYCRPAFTLPLTFLVDLQHYLTTPDNSDITENVASALLCPIIVTGRYTGTGTHGSSNPNSLTFNFVPKTILIISSSIYTFGILHPFSANGIVMYANGSSSSPLSMGSWYGNSIIVSRAATTVTWYSDASENTQMNASGKSYCYVAIG